MANPEIRSLNGCMLKDETARAQVAQLYEEINGRYELIEKITLEEPTQVIVRDKSPNGTPFELKTIYVHMKVPPLAATPANQNCVAYIGDGTDNYYASLHFSTVLGTSGTLLAWGTLLVFNGYLVPIYSKGQTYSPAAVTTSAVGLKEAKTLKRLQLGTANGADKMPTGTIIEIWGVKA